MQYHEVFPTVIATDTYAGEIDSKITSLEYVMGTSHHISLNHSVLDLEYLSNLKKYILDQLKNYYQNVLFEKNVIPFITQSWVNRTEKGQNTHPHRHPNSIVSGVFYVDANDSIEFYDSNPSSFNINKTVKRINVSTNDLILFPSTLLHYVPPHSESKTRFSIAFNSFATGTFGDDKKLTGLTI